ncbi:MAG: extracellular solute-binding protein [Anaerolineales bacterium]|nr:extracellular solute-binding protein [Anaerolineales bacterium]
MAPLKRSDPTRPRYHPVPKWMAVCVVLFLAIIGLPACQSSSEVLNIPTEMPDRFTPTTASTPTQTAEPTPASTGEIIIWLDWEPEEMEALQEIIQSFLSDNPTVDFSLSYYPTDELMGAFEDASRAGTPPTILLGPSHWGPRLYDGEMILDASSMVNAELERRIHPTAWTQVAYDSHMLGLPLEFQGVVLFRNRSRAAEAPRTVELWIEEGLGQREKDQTAIVLDLGFGFSAPQLSVCDGSFIGPQAEIALELPQGICWLELMRDLRAIGPALMNSDEDLSMFLASESAWLIEETSRIGELARAIGVTNLKVDPWPLYEPADRPLQSLVWTENIYLSSGIPTKDLEVTWAFVEHIYSSEAQARLSDFQGAAHIPVDTTVEIIDSNMVEMASMLSSGVPLSLWIDLEDHIKPIEDAVGDVIFQGVEPAVAAQLLIDIMEQVHTPSEG